MRVSVIIPTFNRARLLAEAIQSSLGQRGVPELEVIVVDDGSSDDTRSCVRHVQEGDTRLQYVYQKNRGPSAARNTGLRNATGEFVQFLDSDDLLLPGKISRQIRVFDGDAGVGVNSCHCTTECIRDDGTRAGVYGCS
jgi:glycosyltransferase involved in cell wall biosynthesis